jgi:vancomycin resistance protein YoaR
VLSVTIISITGGILALYYTAHGKILPKVMSGSLDLGGLTKQEAIAGIDEEYNELLKNGELVITYKIKDETNQYKIKFSEIDAAVKSESTVERALDIRGGELFKTLIGSNFLAKVRIITPVISFNREKLLAKLENLSAIINREPRNANIYLIDHKVTKEPDETGLRLNVDKSLKKIEDEIGTHLDRPMEFNPENEFEIEVLRPEFTSENLKYAQEVISSYTTEINSYESDKFVRLAAKAINKVWVEGRIKEEPGEFSFNRYLSNENGIREQNIEGYNQVVSTLNAALIMAGIENITRTPHKTPTDYIEPGLDAVVFGNTIDFKFKNTLEGAIVIFASVRDNKLTVSLVGKKRDKQVSAGFKVEIEQKNRPAVINVENDQLQSGEKRTVYEGKEGLKVNVYRVTIKDGIEIERRLLYKDQYKPQDRIIEISSDRKPGADGMKEK